MQRRIPLKNHHREIQLTANRMMIALIVIFLLIFSLAARLYFLQVYKHDVYITLSTKNWLDLVPVEPTRGLIYDRNGVLLAENIPVFSLDVFPYQVNNFSKTLTALSKIVALSENDISQFKRQLKQHRRFDEIPLKLRLTEAEVARFAENAHRFPGVMIKARLMRHYPYGESFSHVIGYVGRINTQELNEIDQINYSASHYLGKTGIEKYYEKALHGSVGYQEVENDASGKPIRVLKEIKGTPGKNLYLSLDAGLQFAAERALVSKGAVVVIQPETGQLLAMVSKPGYDPNLFVTGINQKDYLALQQSPDRPLYDRALRGLYPLASTIKPYLALQALDAGIITPEFTIVDQGTFQLHNDSHVFHDLTRHGHGKVNLNKAIYSSCNIYFYDLATKMGIRLMDNVLEQFGFGATTGIDLVGESPGILASPEWKLKAKGTHWYAGDTILTGIGQGYMQATPLQLATATATLANHGKRFRPYLLLGEQLASDHYQALAPVELPPIVLNDNRYWQTIIQSMQNVISERQGTGYHFGTNLNYSIAAKTGTAQASKRRNPEIHDNQDNLPEKLRDHHLFIAFAPVEKPKIAIAIITENSNTAIQAAREIFDYYLTCRNDKRILTHSLLANVAGMVAIPPTFCEKKINYAS